MCVCIIQLIVLVSRLEILYGPEVDLYQSGTAIHSNLLASSLCQKEILRPFPITRIGCGLDAERPDAVIYIDCTGERSLSKNGPI